MNLKDRAQQPEGGVYTGFVPDQKPYLKACPKLHALEKVPERTFRTLLGPLCLSLVKSSHAGQRIHLLLSHLATLIGACATHAGTGTGHRTSCAAWRLEAGTAVKDARRVEHEFAQARPPPWRRRVAPTLLRAMHHKLCHGRAAHDATRRLASLLGTGSTGRHAYGS
jgi:hypothetical protein